MKLPFYIIPPTPYRLNKIDWTILTHATGIYVPGVRILRPPRGAGRLQIYRPGPAHGPRPWGQLVMNLAVAVSKFGHQSCDSGPAGLPTSKQKKTFLALDAFCVS